MYAHACTSTHTRTHACTHAQFHGSRDRTQQCLRVLCIYRIHACRLVNIVDTDHSNAWAFAARAAAIRFDVALETGSLILAMHDDTLAW